MLKINYAKCFELTQRNSRLAWFFLACSVISLPPISTVLQLRMSTHMLLQMPLLVALSFWGTRIWMKQALAAGRSFPLVRRFRGSGILLAIFTLMAWMLPRLLDMAVESAAVDAMKVASLLFLAGVPLGLCWPEIGGPVRGVLHLEALATLARMGWIYIETPQRLCLRYGLDEQRFTGQILIILAFLYTFYLLFIIFRGMPIQARLSTEA